MYFFDEDNIFTYNDLILFQNPETPPSYLYFSGGIPQDLTDYLEGKNHMLFCDVFEVFYLSNIFNDGYQEGSFIYIGENFVMDIENGREFFRGISSTTIIVDVNIPKGLFDFTYHKFIYRDHIRIIDGFFLKDI